MKLDKRKYRDKIRGSMMGGAVGDALGYPVEFLSYKEILKQYPPKGIQAYELNFNTRTALISDDTQMALLRQQVFYLEIREKALQIRFGCLCGRLTRSG